MTDTLTLTIDGQEVTVPKGATVMDACKQAEKEIPHFCYHPRLSIAGNCRMCLVEVEGAPKPVASCHWPAADGMVVNTQSETTQKAQKGTMEMLLINHPLDCPICDQGGECDLQDVAVAYGSDCSRYDEPKRAVEDKDIGAKIKTVMTRCIHCTRCIRFATEIAGVEEFGATFRGENMKVGTYVERALVSELAGNMIDLCPVGALTSKPYTFTARPWELTETPSIDVMDALGSHVMVHSRAGEVMRILPRTCEEINEEWMTDTARFSWDGLEKDRLTTPITTSHGGKRKRAGWVQAFEEVKFALHGTTPAEIGVLIGGGITTEGLYAAQQFFTQTLKVPSKNINVTTGWNGYQPEHRALRTLNTPVAQFEEADAILLIGSNPRLEAPLLNLRMRKAALKGAAIGNIGLAEDLTYPVQQLGTTTQDLEKFMEGKSAFYKTLKKANKPLILIGNAAQSRADANAITAAAAALAEKVGGTFNALPKYAGRTAALDIFGPSQTSMAKVAEKAKVVFVYGKIAGTIQPAKGQTIIYLGTHNSDQAKLAHIALPTAAFTEQNGWWTNAEGRVQEAKKAVNPPLQAKEDWKIFRALSENLAQALPFNTLAQLREEVAKIHPAYQNIGQIVPNEMPPLKALKTGKLQNKAFGPAITDFYLTTEVLRASPTMQKCQAEWNATNLNIKKAG